MFKKLTRFTLILWAIGLSLAYFAVSLVVSPPYLINILNGIFIGIVIAVIIVYAPLVKESVISNKFDRTSQLSIGIGVLWLSIAMSRIWSAYYSYKGSSIQLLNHPIIGYITFLAIIGGILFVTAPGYYLDGEKRPNFGGKNLKLVVSFAILGGILASIISFNTNNNLFQ